MSSYSTSDGAMSLTITFKLGTDLDQAQVLVQNRVAIAKPRLPEDVRRLGITTLKSSPDLMMVVHLLSPDDSYDQLYVSNYARTRVRDVLLRLDGVGDLIIFGEREYSLADLARPGTPVRLRHDRRRRRRAHCASRTCRCRAARSAPSRRPPTRPSSYASPPRAASRIPAQFPHVIVKADDGGQADPPAGRGPRRARRAGLRHQLLSQRQAGGGARHLPAARHQRARRRRPRSSTRWRS